MSLLADYQRHLDDLVVFRPQRRTYNEFSGVHLDMLRVLEVDPEIIHGAQAYLGFRCEYARCSSRIRSDLKLCASLTHR